MMIKKWMCVGSVLASLLATAPALAVDQSVNTLTVNPGSLLLGRLRLELEHAMDGRTSVYGGIHMLVNEPFLETGPGGRVSGSGIDLGMRFFTRDGAPAGWWLGPMATVSYLQSSNSSGVGYALSAMGGYTAILDDTIVLSFGVGVAYFDMTLIKENGNEVGIIGVAPRARIAAGFAF